MHERFIGFLIEHSAGNFRLWLAPEQVRILPIGDEPKVREYSMSILNELRAHQVRAEQMKVHTMFVIGKRDMEADAVNPRVHSKGNLGAWPRVEVMVDLLPAVAGPECLGLAGRLTTSLIFFFTFHFQESELVRGVSHYAQLASRLLIAQHHS